MISLGVNEWDTFLERSYTRFVYHCFFFFISSYVCFSFAFWLTQTDIGISQHQHSSGNNNATRHNSIKIEPIMNKMMNRIQWKKKPPVYAMAERLGFIFSFSANSVWKSYHPGSNAYVHSCFIQCSHSFIII